MFYPEARGEALQNVLNYATGYEFVANIVPCIHIPKNLLASSLTQGVSSSPWNFLALCRLYKNGNQTFNLQRYFSQSERPGFELSIDIIFVKFEEKLSKGESNDNNWCQGLTIPLV